MVERQAFDGMRQRSVLAKLQKNTGKEATEVARAVGLSYPQYLRYAWGKVPIRTDQIDAFAEVYQVDPLDLAAELFGVDLYADETKRDADPRWTFRGELHGKIPEELIDELAEDWEGKPILNQMAAARGILQLAEKRRGDFSPKSSRETHTR